VHTGEKPLEIHTGEKPWSSDFKWDYPLKTKMKHGVKLVVYGTFAELNYHRISCVNLLWDLLC
jgi:hypothetical protein